jgi:hypothetical protein
VLLNGNPGKYCIQINFFFNTGDLQQAVINDEWIRGELNLPTDNDFGQKYPIVQYVDDTLMIMPMDAC